MTHLQDAISSKARGIGTLTAGCWAETAATVKRESLNKKQQVATFTLLSLHPVFIWGLCIVHMPKRNLNKVKGLRPVTAKSIKRLDVAV